METVHDPGPAVQVRPLNITPIGGCCTRLALEQAPKKCLPQPVLRGFKHDNCAVPVLGKKGTIIANLLHKIPIRNQPRPMQYQSCPPTPKSPGPAFV